MEHVASAESPEADSAKAAIVTNGLSKRYGSFSALDNLSLRVERGVIFGFLGPNGAGKSTTIRTLLGYLRPTRGGAQVLGHDITSGHLEIARRVGYLPSSTAFDESTTGARALDDLAALNSSDAPDRAELCERLQLPAETLKRRVRTYSRGTRQKLAIVQAFQHKPELAILDEPSEGLDPLVQHAFYGMLEERRDAGMTIFLSSHILSEVERICSRVAVIRAGALVAVEDVQALLARRRRHVQIRFAGDAPDLSAVAGVTTVEHHDGLVTCRLHGDVSPLLKALAAYDVADLIIEPTHLEDVFLEYYASADAHADAGAAS